MSWGHSELDPVRERFDTRPWFDRFMLPYPRSFEDFDRMEELGMPTPRAVPALAYSILLAVVLVVLRYIFTRYIMAS